MLIMILAILCQSFLSHSAAKNVKISPTMESFFQILEQYVIKKFAAANNLSYVVI